MGNCVPAESGVSSRRGCVAGMEPSVHRCPAPLLFYWFLAAVVVAVGGRQVGIGSDGASSMYGGGASSGTDFSRRFSTEVI